MVFLPASVALCRVFVKLEHCGVTSPPIVNSRAITPALRSLTIYFYRSFILDCELVLKSTKILAVSPSLCFNESKAELAR